MSKADCNANEALKLRAEVEQLEAQAAAMREALEVAIEAISNSDAVFCKAAYEQARAALAADAGELLLERLREAERERDAARKERSDDRLHPAHRARALELLHEAEDTLGKLKLARRGVIGILCRRFWRQIDNAWSAVHFAILFLEGTA
jgi:hypothetical protein